MPGVAGLSHWIDRHRQPTAGALLSDLSDDARARVESARQTLSARPGTTETLAWRGIPWRWCFCYARSAADPGEYAWIVPAPEQARIELCIAEQKVGQSTVESLPKSLRHAVLHGNVVGAKRWICVQLDSDSAPNDVIALLNLLGS